MYPTVESFARCGHAVLVTQLLRDDLQGWVNVRVWKSGLHPFMDDRPTYQHDGSSAGLALLNAANSGEFEFRFDADDVVTAFHSQEHIFDKVDKAYRILRRVDENVARSYGSRRDICLMVSAAVRHIAGFSGDARIDVMNDGWIRLMQLMVDAGYSVTTTPVEGFEGYVRATAFNHNNETEIRTVPLRFASAIYELHGHVFGKYHGLKHGEPRADKVELVNLPE